MSSLVHSFELEHLLENANKFEFKYFNEAKSILNLGMHFQTIALSFEKCEYCRFLVPIALSISGYLLLRGIFFSTPLILLTALHCLFFSMLTELCSLLRTGPEYHRVAVVVANVVIMYF